jgi:hypothetical protein
MTTTLPNVVGPEYLVPLLHRALSTIKVDARARPETLPPRLRIPGSSKLLWVEADVIEWLDKCREAKPKAKEDAARPSIFRGCTVQRKSLIRLCIFWPVVHFCAMPLAKPSALTKVCTES